MSTLGITRLSLLRAKNIVPALTESSASHGDVVSDFILNPLSTRSCWLDRGWLAGGGVEVGVAQGRRTAGVDGYGKIIETFCNNKECVFVQML